MNTDVVLPTIPVGILTLAAFFAPYAIGLLNGVLPFVQKPWQKKAVTVLVAVLLAAVLMLFYWAMTGAPLPNWPAFVILSLLIISASYALVTGKSASQLEARVDKTIVVEESPETKPPSVVG